MAHSSAHHLAPQSLPNRFYLQPSDLSRMVRENRRRKRISDEYATALLAIAGGVWDRYRFIESREDFVQECVMHFLGSPVRKANPEMNCFNFFTKCAVRQGLKLRAKELGTRVKESQFREMVADAYRYFGSPEVTEEAHDSDE